MPQQTSTVTLLQRIGGRPALEAAIDGLYIRLLQDDNLNGFFQGLDLRWLKIHQKQFLVAAFTTTEFDLSSALTRLRRAHANLCTQKGLNEKHFDMFAVHLIDTLRELGLADAIVQEVLATVVPLRYAFTRSDSPKKRSPRPAQRERRFFCFRRALPLKDGVSRLPF
jgi:hemoglobin